MLGIKIIEERIKMLTEVNKKLISGQVTVEDWDDLKEITVRSGEINGLIKAIKIIKGCKDEHVSGICNRCLCRESGAGQAGNGEYEGYLPS